MARDERNPLVRVELYQLLGRAYDEALARRALELAMTAEPGATNSSQIIGSVAGAHPDLAFDFALANRERVEALVDVSSRSRFLSGLAAGSADPAMIDKLTAYAARYLTPQSRAPGRPRDRRDPRPDPGADRAAAGDHPLAGEPARLTGQ